MAHAESNQIAIARRRKGITKDPPPIDIAVTTTSPAEINIVTTAAVMSSMPRPDLTPGSCHRNSSQQRLTAVMCPGSRGATRHDV